MRLALRTSRLTSPARRAYAEAQFPQYLLSAPETRVSTTSNGIRVATQQV